MKFKYHILLWIVILLVFLWGRMARAGTPTFVSSGGVSGSATGLTFGWPSGIATGDVLIALVETANEASSMANLNGGLWYELLNSPQGIGLGGATSATRLTGWYAVYNGTQGAPTTNDSGNHQVGVILAYHGVTVISVPYDTTSGGTVASDAPVTITLNGATTDSNYALVLVAVADDWDNASTTRYVNWTNGNLSSITERADGGISTQNGGGLGVAEGALQTAANYGNSTVGQNTAILVDGFMTIALRGSTPTAVTGPPNYIQSRSGSAVIQSRSGSSVIQGR